MTGGGDAPRIFHRRRRRGFMVGGGGVSAQFHSRNELIVHYLIFGGLYKCVDEC